MDVSGFASRPRPRPSLQAGRPPAKPTGSPENGLLHLLDVYRRDPASLPDATSHEIRARLEGFERRLAEGQDRLSFSGVRFIDHDTVCLVFTGPAEDRLSLPAQVNLLVDQQWNISGGIRFDGFQALPLRP